MLRGALLVLDIFTTESVVASLTTLSWKGPHPHLIVASEVETFPVTYLANCLLPPGGYILTQIPIIDGLRRSTDYDDDLGFGRTYDEFDDEYDISTVGPL